MGALWLVGGLTACDAPPADVPFPPTPTPPTALITLGLSDSASKLGDLVSDDFPAERGLLRLVPGNDRVLVADLEAGLLDAVLLHEVPAGANVWFSPVAVDGLVAIVHPDNPVNALTVSQVQSAFAGRTTSWDDFGGTGEAISLVVREPGAGPRLLFQERVMAEGRVAITALMAASDEQMRAAIAAAPASIGYSMMGQLNAEVKALTLDGVQANPTMVTSQTYPLSVPIYYVSLAEPVGAPRGLLAWMQSDAGQAAIGEFYGRVR